MSSVKITGLQDEILEKIFSCVIKGRNEALENLSLVCKRFNQVISSSGILMDEFEVRWNSLEQEDLRVLIKSNRKHRNIYFKGEFKFTAMLLIFIHANSSTINSIYLDESCIKCSELVYMFDIVGANLKVLTFDNITYVEDVDYRSVSLPKLSSLYIQNTNSSILKLFANATNIKMCDIYFDKLECAKPLVEFLLAQDNLKDFGCDQSLEMIFKDNLFMDNINFNMEEFGFIAYKNEYSIDIIKNFIKKHQDTLKILKLTNVLVTTDLLEFITNLKDLKTLDFTTPTFLFNETINVQGSTIDKLILCNNHDEFEGLDDENGFSELVKSFSNTRELVLDYINVSHKLLITIGINLRNLEKLSFMNCEILPFPFPKVKFMDFSHCLEYSSILSMMQLNRQLKEVVLPKQIKSHAEYSIVMNQMQLEKVFFDG